MISDKRLQLILARIEILKLKANNHDWQCYVPKDVKEQLENTLLEINLELGREGNGNSSSDGSDPRNILSGLDQIHPWMIINANFQQRGQPMDHNQPYCKAISLTDTGALILNDGEEIIGHHWDNNKNCWQVLVAYYPAYEDENDADE